MPKIATYNLADTPLQLSDRLVGTEAPRPTPSATPLATKNFSLGELLQLFSSHFPAASLQAVLDTGNYAIQDITLVGNIKSTLIEPENIKDYLGSEGSVFQFLSKASGGVNWVDLPVDDLQSVLDKGNTATQDIILNGNIFSTLIAPENIKDEDNNLGIVGQVLTKSSTGIIWKDSPSSLTPGLNDVLLVGNTATNDIILTGNISSTLITPENIQDENSSLGSDGQALIKTTTGLSWQNLPSSNEIIGATVITGDNYIIELEKSNGSVIPIEFAQSFRHIQSVNSDTWVVIHNLGFRPSVTIIDLDGDVVNGDITYDTNNQLTLTFAQPIKGEAYLN